MDMPKIWKVFCGDYFINPNPVGSYEEASALVAYGSAHDRSSWRKGGYDFSPGFRRSKSRLKILDMGSKVSRHSGKGLSGRRAQSSGSLYRILAPRVGGILNPCKAGVRQTDRNKFCGSLPNNLDDKQISSGGNSPETRYDPASNYDQIYLVRSLPGKRKAKSVDAVLREQEPGGGDQGYGSEWSPEDELPLPQALPANLAFHRYSMPGRDQQTALINKGTTFEARLEKGSRGLGLSITGGIDVADRHPGFIRIKRIFPHQPAWEYGILQLGDIILEANGIALTGLTNHEALEVLRTTPNSVVLKICRPPADTFSVSDSFAEEEAVFDKRDPNRRVVLPSQCSTSNNKLPLSSTEPYGEFDVILNKVNGSLGFTLRKEDESILGHYIRALVREPAISDGRIRPGDKIVSVNGKDISHMTHGEAVAFLRQIGDEVKLRLYRDPAQTPISALSPTETHKMFRPRPALRKEAVDMLNTLAVKKLSPSDPSGSGGKNRLRNTSPRHSPRTRKPADASNETELSESKTEDFISSLLQSDSIKQEISYRSLSPGRSEPTEPTEPTSMPQMVTSTSDFGYNNPIYQSAYLTHHPDDVGGKEKNCDHDVAPPWLFEKPAGSQGLLKWKGVVFAKEEEPKHAPPASEVLTVELSRGWNSRLGFSLRSSGSKTLISTVYPDSVAAKDGRLQCGDEVIMINNEPVQEMRTSDVIDLLRKVRGSIAITVMRAS